MEDEPRDEATRHAQQQRLASATPVQAERLGDAKARLRLRRRPAVHQGPDREELPGAAAAVIVHRPTIVGPR